MPTFSTSDDLYSFLTPFYEALAADPEIGPKFVSANTTFRLIQTEPDAVILLDATTDPPVVTVGDDAMAADAEVEVTMTADDGHQFWQGQLNLPLAIARRRAKVSGPVAKLIGMLPAIKPAYAKYKAYLAETERAAS